MCTAEFKTTMKVYFTSPILGQIYGTVTKKDQRTYLFKGANALINIELVKTEDSKWVCRKDAWLLDSQIMEIGLQIDQMDAWLSAK